MVVSPHTNESRFQLCGMSRDGMRTLAWGVAACDDGERDFKPLGRKLSWGAPN